MSEAYNLPAQVALALTTNRPELISDGFIEKGVNPRVFLTLEAQRDLMRLVRDLIADRVKAEEARRRELDSLHEHVSSQLASAEKTMERLRRRVDAIETLAQETSLADLVARLPQEKSGA